MPLSPRTSGLCAPTGLAPPNNWLYAAVYQAVSDVNDVGSNPPRTGTILPDGLTNSTLSIHAVPLVPRSFATKRLSSCGSVSEITSRAASGTRLPLRSRRLEKRVQSKEPAGDAHADNCPLASAGMLPCAPPFCAPPSNIHIMRTRLAFCGHAALIFSPFIQ